MHEVWQCVIGACRSMPVRASVRGICLSKTLACDQMLWRSLGDDRATSIAALGTKVDEPVAGLHHIEVVLDDDYRVTFVDESLQHQQQLVHVFEVQAGGGLVENVDCLAGGTSLQLGGQLHALGFATRQRGGWLSETDISQPDVHQCVKVA